MSDRPDDNVDPRKVLLDQLKKHMTDNPPSGPSIQLNLKAVTIALAACAQMVGKDPSELDLHQIAINAKLLGAELFNDNPPRGGKS
jgi:hypothetical protein